MWTALRFISAWAMLLPAWMPEAGAALEGQAEIPSHGAAITALRAWNSGGHLASASADGTLKVWRLDSDSGAPQVLSDFPAWTHEAVLGGEAGWVAAALAGGEIRVWTLADRRLALVLRPRGGETLCLAASPDGSLLAAGGARGELSLWSMPGGRLLKHIDSAHGEAVWDLDFSSDGKLLASGSKDETLRFWTSQGQPLKRIDKFDGPVAALAFQPGHPDRVAAASWDGRISRVEVRESDGGRKGKPDRALFQVRSLAFSPDGQRLAAGGYGASLVLWNMADWPQSTSYYFQGHGLRSVAFSPDGRLLAGGGDDRHLRFWEAGGRLLREKPYLESGAFTSVAFLPDGKRLLTASWGSLDGASLKIRGPQSEQSSDLHAPARAFGGLALSREVLAAASGDAAVRLWNRSGSLRTVLRADAPVRALDLSPGGGLLAAALENGSVQTWKLDADGPSPAWTRSLHLGAATSLRFLPSGRRLAVGGRDGFLHLLEADSGRSLWKIRNDFSIAALDVDSSGTRLAWGTVQPAAAWIDLDPQGTRTPGTKAADGESPDPPATTVDQPPNPPQTIALDQESLNGLALSADGRYLATAAGDSLGLWQLPPLPAFPAAQSGQPQPSGRQASLLANRQGPYSALTFLADGRLAAATAEARIEILQAASLRPLRTLHDWSQPVLIAQSEARPTGRLDKASLSSVRLTAPQWCGSKEDGRCRTRNGLLLLRLQGPDFRNGARLDWGGDGMRVQHSGFVARGGTYFLPQGLVVELLPDQDLAAGDNLLIDRLALSRQARAFRPGLRRGWRWDQDQEEWTQQTFDLAMQEFPQLEDELRLQSLSLPQGALWLGNAERVLAYPADRDSDAPPQAAAQTSASAKDAQQGPGPSQAPRLSPNAPPNSDARPGSDAASASAPGTQPPSTAPAGASVQADPATTPTFTTSVDLVNVLVTVWDASGRYVTGLERDDFVLEEEGAPQIVTYFSSDDEAPPLSVGVVIDTSESVEEKLDFERQAANEFLRSVLTRSHDAAAVIEFGSTVKLACDFSNDLGRLQNALSGIYVHGRTRLFDGIWLAVEDLLAQRSGRRILVLLSDGEDTNSILNAREAIRQAQDHEVLIFGIGVRAPGEASDFDQIRRLAESTGGLFFDSRADLERLRQAFEAIRQAIAAQYSLGYAPQEDGTPGYRSLRVTVPNRRVTVTHRSGYHYQPPR